MILVDYLKKNKNFLIGVALLLILSFILRVWFISNDSVSFHYDMARDAFVAEEIWRQKDFKILGPPTSTPGLYHGVIYYYLIAPFYALGKGDPRYVAFALSFINSLSIIAIVKMATGIFKSLRWGLLGGLLFAVSFESSQYGPWLSNPSPAIFTVSMFFYSIWLIFQKNKLGLPLSFFWAALSMQFQFFLVHLFVFLLIFIMLFKIKVRVKEAIFSIFLTILTLLPLLLPIVKFNSYQIFLKSLFEISTSGQFDFRTQFTDLFLNYLNRFMDIFINNFFPSNILVGGLMATAAIYISRHNYFILSLLLSNLLLFVFGGHSAIFVNVGMVTPAILSQILLTKKILEFGKLRAVFYILIILISNLYTIYKLSPRGQIAMVIPKDMVLKEQLKLIDKTYKVANGTPFSINSLTLPLWTNTTWSYLYHFYGEREYGYLPSFYGRDQSGLPGGGILDFTEKPLKKTFYIIEPSVGIPQNFYKSEQEAENSRTKLIDEVSFRSIKLQIREPLTR